MYHAARKIPDQLKYADKKEIPFVWFPFADGHKIKDMKKQEQSAADPSTWEKP
jgi:histidyl-tRNA synthetase